MSSPATPLPDEKLVKVFDTEQESEALVVKALLDSAGVDAQIGDAENAPDVMPLGGVGILVREEDADQARQVIDSFRRTPEQEASEEADFDASAVAATDAEPEP
jgi:Putative prokaryotic signal transducing protein